jgi:hypothetical protein
MILVCIWEVSCLNLDWGTDGPDDFRGFCVTPADCQSNTLKWTMTTSSPVVLSSLKELKRKVAYFVIFVQIGHNQSSCALLQKTFFLYWGLSISAMTKISQKDRRWELWHILENDKVSDDVC